MRTLACDLDGTADSDPQIFQDLFTALRAAGWQVVILTGLKGAKQIGPEDVAEKQKYIAGLGIDAYDHLAVFPDVGQLPQLKARWIEQHGADIFIDNNKGNLQAALPHTLCLLPWGTRMGSKKDAKVKKALTVIDGLLETP